MNTYYNDNYDNLPISITHQYKYFKEYNNCMEELLIDAGDYKFRMNIKGMNKIHHQFLMLELKNYITKRFMGEYGVIKIKYSGGCFEKRWINNSNEKVLYHSNTQHNNNMDYNFYNIKHNDIAKLYNIMPIVKKYINELCIHIDKKHWSEYTLTDKDIWDVWKKYHSQIRETANYTKTHKTDTHYLAYKVCVKKLDYSKSYVGYYSVLNLKYYDKITKKPTNKGLKANGIWTYEDNEKRKTHWTFGGFKVENLRLICVINGYDNKKAKKDQYGVLAEWYIKL